MTIHERQEERQQERAEDKRVLVAMSGGVDSSVTAALLKTQGYEVIGVHMQLWDHGDANLDRLGGRCCSLVDSNDARRVCDRLDIPYYVVNAQDVFLDKVVDYFVHEYMQSRTPNPCVQCNTQIKFNYLFRKADELGCELVATGHYAQVALEFPDDPRRAGARLLKAGDPQKDQSYFLFGLTQKALVRTLMPLGGFPKMAVRRLAEEYGLLVAGKPDSQEICFIGGEGYKGFIEQRVPVSLRPAGIIRTVEGQVVGEHQGLHRYTIGQRKGLTLNGKETEEFYVVGFDTLSQTLIVGPEPFLFSKTLQATHVNWITPGGGRMAGLRCRARIRSRHEEAPCLVTVFENETVSVEFDEPQRAVTPGQAVVFYEGSEVLGGGFIERSSAMDAMGAAVGRYRAPRTLDALIAE